MLTRNRLVPRAELYWGLRSYKSNSSAAKAVKQMQI